MMNVGLGQPFSWLCLIWLHHFWSGYR